MSDYNQSVYLMDIDEDAILERKNQLNLIKMPSFSILLLPIINRTFGY